MAHYYSASGEPIELELATDDIGIRFGGAEGPGDARRAATIVRKATSRAVTPAARQFHRFVMLHESNAAALPVGSIASALPLRLAKRVERPLPVFVEKKSRMKLITTEEIVVRFKPGTSVATHKKLLSGLELTTVRTSDYDPDAHIVVPTSLRRASRALDLANQLAEASDIVDYAAPNFITEVRKHALPRLFGQQWHLANTGQHGGKAYEDVSATGAWALAGGGKTRIVVAIIDDGVDIVHPDLKSNIWENPKKGAKDRHGRDFVNDRDKFNPRPKVFQPPFDDTTSNDIHGTACAGIVAASGKGVKGIAYECTILPVKVFAASLAPLDRIADGIRYATRHADVLSCSWGAPQHPDIESAVRDAVTLGRRGKGAAVFVATGNEYEKEIGFPSNHPQAFGVGASNDRGRRSKYSNYGKGIAFVAPSSDEDRDRQGITTTDVSSKTHGYSSGNYCDDFGGTSSATPLVAGIAALMLSANDALSWQDVGGILKETADKIGGSGARYRSGFSLQYGFGRVNAEAAVKAALARRHAPASARRKATAKKR
jgi:subtilisin family serine protease